MSNSTPAAKSREYLFEKESIPKAVFQLSLPTICSNLVVLLYSLADTFFVGVINSPVQSAAVSLASPILLAFNAVNNLFGVGASSMMSRALGAKDEKTLRRSSALGFYGALFFSLIFSFVAAIFIHPLCSLIGATEETYLATRQYMIWAVILNAPFGILNVVMAYLVRAEGNTLHASIGTMLGAFMNIILDPVFILFFGLKAQGAGIATLLGNMCAVLYFFIYLYVKRDSTKVCISFKECRWSTKVISGICAVGVPACIQNLLNVVSQLIINNLAAGYGTVAVAAMGIAFRSTQILMYIGMGISQGVMPLIGYTYAAGMIDRMKHCIFYTMRLSLVILAAITIVFELFPQTIMEVFIGDPQTIAIGSVLIRGMALSNPFLALDFTCVGVFQACGKGLNSLILAILRKGVFEIPFMLAFNQWFGLNGLGFSALLAEILMSIIGMIMLFHLLKTTKKRLEAAGAA